MILDFLLENSFLLVFWLGISELFFRDKTFPFFMLHTILIIEFLIKPSAINPRL